MAAEHPSRRVVLSAALLNADAQTGVTKPYTNPQGKQASVADTAAF